MRKLLTFIMMAYLATVVVSYSAYAHGNFENANVSVQDLKDINFSIQEWLHECERKQPLIDNIVCEYNAQKMWEYRIHEIYRKLMLRLNKQQREDLRKSQKDWERFVQSEKKFIIDTEIHPSYLNKHILENFAEDDIMNLYKQRARRLKYYLEMMR